jgi:competence protein ComEC
LAAFHLAGYSPHLAAAATAAIVCLWLRTRWCDRRRALICCGCLVGSIMALVHAPSPLAVADGFVGREVQLTVVIERPFNARSPDHWAGIVRVIDSDFAGRDLRGQRIAIYTASDRKTLLRGEQLEVRLAVERIRSDETIDSYGTFLLGQGIRFQGNSGQAGERVALAPLHENLRHHLYQGAILNLTAGRAAADSAGQVLASMMLGERSLLSDERIALYRSTGTYHLFAVSGLHVGAVAMALFALARCLLPRVAATWTVVFALWGYVWLTGGTPSAVRAGIMLSCLLLCRILLRQPHHFPALVVAACVTFLIDPQQLRQLGFQLSYLVVAAILVHGIPSADYLQQRLLQPSPPPCTHPWIRRLHGTVRLLLCRCLQLTAVAVSAGCVSSPLIIHHFELFTPVTPLTSVPLHLLVIAAITLGTACLLTSWLPFSALAHGFALLAFPPITLMEHILAWMVAIPWAFSHATWAFPAATVVSIALFFATAFASYASARRYPLLLVLPPATSALCLALFLRSQNTAI